MSTIQNGNDEEAQQQQQRGLSRVRWVQQMVITPVPEQYRFAFALTVVRQNFERMVFASKLGVLIFILLIVMVDVFNLPAIPENKRFAALALHLGLGITLLIGYIFGRRLQKRVESASLWQLFAWGTLFRSLYTILAYMIFYQMGSTGLNTSGSFATFVALITAGLYADLRYTLTLAFVNAIIYTGIVGATSNSMALTAESLFIGYCMLGIAVFSSELLFRSFRQEFAMTKQIEEERRKAEELNAQLTDANEEISRQMEMLNEQAREIEMSNTALQEKSLELEAEKRTLAKANEALEQEQTKTDTLLHNVLPVSIANRLKSGEQHIANHYDTVTVLFADIVGFTTLSASRPAVEIVQILNRIFSAFDIFSEHYHLEKIKTIGDAYMIVGGLPEYRADHCEAVAQMALEMLSTIELLEQSMGVSLQLRIGIHTGSVVAGVIGQKKFAYDLWGDTVNTASRMESRGEPGKIHCTTEVYEALHEKFTFESRGEIEIKGKGFMQTWFLIG